MVNLEGFNPGSDSLGGDSLQKLGYVSLRLERPMLAGDIKPFEGVVLSNGQILLATLDGKDQSTKVARLNADGSIDTSFGSVGYVALPGYASAGLAMTARSNGDVWIAMNRGDNSSLNPMQLYQISQNGNLLTHILSDPAVLKVQAISEDKNGNLVYLGWGRSGLVFTNGKSRSSFLLGSEGVESSKINPDGSAIVLVKTGGSGNTATQALSLIKFSSSGIIDPSFGANGVVQFKSYLDQSGTRLEAFGGSPPPQVIGVKMLSCIQN